MDKSFFEPEIRSGYLVSSEIKKLWAIQLELLEALEKICKEYKLTYFAQGGTLLGAVRHNGFIPWDDDVDIIMLWDDYKVLLEVAPDYFKYPYFFQSYLTEAEAEPTFSRLRHSNTTGCTKFELECITPEYNKGIFIDIFPLFNVPDNKAEREKQILEIKNWWEIYKGYEVHREKKLNGFSKLSKEYDKFEEKYMSLIPHMAFGEIKQRYINACSRISERTEYVAPLSFRSNSSLLTWPREWFDKKVDIPFENLKLPCPKDYKKMLQHQYGQWEIPVVNGAMHEMGIFDASVPYKEKLQGVYVRDYFSTDYEELIGLLRDVYNSSIQKELLEEYLNKDKFILIAILQNKMVGCAFLSINKDYIRNRYTSFVTYLAVDKKYRRIGVAKKIIAECERKTRAFGCTAIELTSADHRIEAHSFYKDTGFTRKKTTVFIKELY